MNLEAKLKEIKEKAEHFLHSTKSGTIDRGAGMLAAVREIEEFLSSDEAKAEKRMDAANELLCPDDDKTIEEMVALIEEENKVNPDQTIDYIDGVNVWEKVEYSFTCRSFLEHIRQA